MQTTGDALLGLACFLRAVALLRFDSCLIFSNHHPTPRTLSTWQRQPAARKEDIRFFRRLFALAVMMLIGQKIECEMSQVCSRFLRSDASLVSRHPPYAWLGTPYQEGCLSTTARCHIITVAFLSCPSVECRCILLTRRRLRHQVRV
jgi:hypothetical protein